MALRALLPQALRQAAPLAVFMPLADHHSANARLMAHFVSSRPGNVLVLPSYCIMHQLMLALKTIWTALGFMNCLFCTVHLLHMSSNYRDYMDHCHALVRQLRLERSVCGALRFQHTAFRELCISRKLHFENTALREHCDSRALGFDTTVFPKHVSMRQLRRGFHRQA